MTGVLPSTGRLQLDGGSLTIDDVVAFARGDVECSLTADAQEKVRASRELRQQLITSGIPITASPPASAIARTTRSRHRKPAPCSATCCAS